MFIAAAGFLVGVDTACFFYEGKAGARAGGRMSAESSLGLPVPFRVSTPAAFLAWRGTALLRFSSPEPCQNAVSLAHARTDKATT